MSFTPEGEANNHAARVWLGILRSQLPRIEGRLVQWIAQGRVRVRSRKLSSQSPAPSLVDSRAALKAAAVQAVQRYNAAMAKLKSADAKRLSAAAALEQAPAKKGKENPELRAALDAAEEEASTERAHM